MKKKADKYRAWVQFFLFLATLCSLGILLFIVGCFFPATRSIIKELIMIPYVLAPLAIISSLLWLLFSHASDLATRNSAE